MSTYQKMLVILLFVMTAFFAFFHLSESPAFNSDEGWYIQTCANLIHNGIDGLQLAPGYIDHISLYISVGYPFVYSLALWFKIFGIGIIQGRALMAIFLVGFSLLGFFVSKRLYGSKIAIGALILIATFPPLYGNGKAIMGEMPGMFLMVLTLFIFSFVRTNPSHKTWLLILTGLSAGLFMATKASFLVLGPALLVAVIIEWRRKTLSSKDISIAIVCTIVPLILWMALKFQPGDSIFSVIGFYANPSKVSSFSGTILHNIKSLFTDLSPLYVVMMMLAWFASLIIRMHKKLAIGFEETTAFIFSVLTIISFTRTAGFYRYLFPAQVIALIFLPNSLNVLWTWLSGKLNFLARPISFWAVIGLLGIFGLYQLCFHSYVADTYNSHDIADIQSYFDTIPTSTSMYFYNSTGLVPFFHGTDYWQYLILFNQADWTIGSSSLPILIAGKPDTVVAGPASDKDETAGVFRDYVTVKSFDKIDIMKRR